MPDPDVFDRQTALRLTGGDADTLQMMVDLFLSERGPQMEGILQAYQAADGSSLSKAAHKLKGSLVIFGARRATDAVLAIEALARGGDLAAFPAAWECLRQEVALLEAALQEPAP